MVESAVTFSVVVGGVAVSVVRDGTRYLDEGGIRVLHASVLAHQTYEHLLLVTVSVRWWVFCLF